MSEVTHITPFTSSMLIYYLQSIARSLKFTNNQLRMKIQTVSMVKSTFTYSLMGLQ